VPADVVEVFATGVESKIEDIETVVDSVTGQLELANKATSALVRLVHSMRREALRAKDDHGGGEPSDG
jgi:hypothetical protein